MFLFHFNLVYESLLYLEIYTRIWARRIPTNTLLKGRPPFERQRPPS